MTPQELNDFLEDNILVIDGATGTMLQNYHFGPEVYGGEEFQMVSDLLVFSRPQASKEVHLKYFSAGAHAVETNTFGASPLRLKEFDFSRLDLTEYPTRSDGIDLRKLSYNEFSYYLNKEAAEIGQEAKKEFMASDEYDGRPLFVLGSIGPSNHVLTPTSANLTKGTFDQIEINFYQQVKGLIDGGVDILLFETQQDMLELKAGIFGAKRAMKERGIEVPIVAQVTVDQFSKMQIFHTDINAALTTIQCLGVQVFGINCSIGPDLMETTVKKLSQFSNLPISVIPNAGLPESENGQTVFKLKPEELAAYTKKFVEEYGINMVGGCCGTTPDHIRAVADAVRNLKPKKRTQDRRTFIAGPQQAVVVDGKESLIRIGERLNVRGSKKVRLAVEQSEKIDQEALEEVISGQVDDLGVEIIDVCMDSNLVDTSKTLVKVIQGQTMDFGAAMCLDSFDVDALEEGIKVYPGRPIINSVSLEEYAPGVDKIDAVVSVTGQHAPLYIALTTGPKGPATTADEKVELAGKIVGKMNGKHGVPVENILVDINAFPIGSESQEGMNFALESINSISRIKEMFPGILITIGVGNLTNGLAKKPYMRKVLTSVFLDEARKEGLDAAIINPNHYVPVDSLPPEDVALGLDVIFNHNMDAFEQLEEIAESKKGRKVQKKVVYDELSDADAVCEKIKDGYKDREKGSFEVDGRTFEYSDRIVLQVAEIIKSKGPVEFINDYLMKAMEDLGSGFAEGLVSLPHLLKSADVMKQVMGFLESFMKDGDEEGINYKGTVVLGTVYQDVHSIGKDLTKTLLENYGYRVIDLGVQVPLQSFIDAAVKHKADAIGMSALLVQTSNHMITLAKMLNEQGMKDMPILIGGAPVNHRHAATVSLAGEEDIALLKGHVFYCHSAMDGVNCLNDLTDLNRKEALFSSNLEKLREAHEGGVKRRAKKKQLLKELPVRKIKFADNHPVLKSHASVVKIQYTLRDFLPFLKETQLFTLNWRFGGKGSWEKKGVDLEELRRLLNDWVERIDKEKWIVPQAVYATFRCIRENKDVVVLDQHSSELGRFSFNDFIGSGNKDVTNIAHYFKADKPDVIGVLLSTGGPAVTAAIESIKNEDKEAAWMLQGLSDRVAEDLASHTNRVLEKVVWGGDGGPSCRYSPGYPALENLSNNKLITQLLSAEQKIGVKLTEGFQFEPTGTTGAVVCFHPEAGYR